MKEINFNELSLKIWTAIIMHDERNRITAPTQREIQRVIEEYFQKSGILNR